MAEAAVLRWEEPPPPVGPNPGGRPARRCWDAAAEELRSRYGEWAVLYDGPADRFAGLASEIRAGVLPCFRPAGDFDAVTRQHSGHRTVYARYLGDGEG